MNSVCCRRMHILLLLLLLPNHGMDKEGRTVVEWNAPRFGPRSIDVDASIHVVTTARSIAAHNCIERRVANSPPSVSHA